MLFKKKKKEDNLLLTFFACDFFSKPWLFLNIEGVRCNGHFFSKCVLLILILCMKEKITYFFNT